VTFGAVVTDAPATLDKLFALQTVIKLMTIILISMQNYYLQFQVDRGQGVQTGILYKLMQSIIPVIRLHLWVILWTSENFHCF